MQTPDNAVYFHIRFIPPIQNSWFIFFFFLISNARVTKEIAKEIIACEVC